MEKVVDDAQRDNVNIDKHPGQPWDVPAGIISMLIGTLAVYCALFATGNWIYGNYLLASVLTLVVAVSIVLLMRIWSKLKIDLLPDEDFNKS